MKVELVLLEIKSLAASRYLNPVFQRTNYLDLKGMGNRILSRLYAIKCMYLYVTGYRVLLHCTATDKTNTQCQLCDYGTYMDHPNSDLSCRRCEVCNPNGRS